MNSKIGLSAVMIILRFLQIFNTYGKGDTDIFTNWNDPVSSSESEVNKESILNFWLD